VTDDPAASRPELAALVRLRRGPDRPDPDPFLRALAGALADARRDVGLSQGKLGRALGINRATVSRWEAAERTPTIPHLRRLGQLLGRPAGRILDDAEDRLARDDHPGTTRHDGEDADAAAD
jgi:transcriptional regulator with XRE-family HTH domain